MDNAFSRFSEMLRDLNADIDRYVVLHHKPRWAELLASQGLWVMARYRFSRWVLLYVHVPVVRQILRGGCLVAQKVVEVLTHCEVPDQATIGPGMFMAHAYCIVIHQDAVIGSNCSISHGVTIGVAGRHERRGVPKLGDRVLIAPGAQIMGNLVIESDVAIGANTVVTKNLPANAVAVGMPAKVISYEGTQGLITLPSDH